MFTRLGKRQTERELSALMNAIQAICKNNRILYRSSLFLTGGYGRGEGGDRAGNNAATVKNNLDLLLVSNHRPTASIARRQLANALDAVRSQLRADISLSSKSRRQLKINNQFNHDLKRRCYPIHDGLKLVNTCFREILAPSSREAIMTLRNRSVLLLMARHEACDRARRLTLYAKFFHGVLDAICLHNGSYKTLISEKESQLTGDRLRQYFADTADFNWFRRAVFSASCYRFYSTRGEKLECASSEATERLRPVATKLLALPAWEEGGILTRTLEERYAPTNKERIRSLICIPRGPSLGVLTTRTGTIPRLSASIIQATFGESMTASEAKNVCEAFRVILE